MSESNNNGALGPEEKARTQCLILPAQRVRLREQQVKNIHRLLEKQDAALLPQVSKLNGVDNQTFKGVQRVYVSCGYVCTYGACVCVL